MPAIIMAEKARYGLPDEPGQRNSRRLALGLLPVSGIRMQADRMRGRVHQVHRRLEARHEPVVGVHRGVGERQQTRSPRLDTLGVVVHRRHREVAAN
jgi:hypothetical protein